MSENYDLQEPGEHENIAATLARLLPQSEVAHHQVGPSGTAQDTIAHLAVPKGFALHAIDNEPLLPHPRRTRAVATLNDADSFIAYVHAHRGEGSTVWCNFNPQTFALDFTAVIDEHAKGSAGWRSHQAKFKPELSAEWKVWAGNNGASKAMGQVGFAEFLEANDTDITSVEGMPSSLQMMAMATEFVATQDMTLKSTVRMQGGGVNLTYVADADKGTLEQMKVFERFAIGIPVFWSASAFRIDARLKYRLAQAKVIFYYELIRHDRVHEAAAKELIEKVKASIGDVPLRMGSCA